MLLEQAISRRASVRTWQIPSATTNITLSELSYVLWAASGYSRKNPAERTSASIDGNHPIAIFIVNSTATYVYRSKNHSLNFWNSRTKNDMIYTDLCWGEPNTFNADNNKAASVILLLVWNMSVTVNRLFAHFNVGCIIQNVYLAANSIGLGTVSQSYIEKDRIRSSLGLSLNYEPLMTMPLGYPQNDYAQAGPYTENMTNNLPEVRFSDVNLDTALDDLRSFKSWSTLDLSTQELSQLLWAAYGYTNVTRFGETPTKHRTIPSAYALYPFRIYALNASGVYLYEPESHSMIFKTSEDKRLEVTTVCGTLWAAEAPTVFVIVYDETKNTIEYPYEYFYLEAGLISQELHLEASAWNLSTMAIGEGLNDYNGTGASNIRNILALSLSEIPFFIQPVGHIQKLEVGDVIIRTENTPNQVLSTDPGIQYYANTSITSSTSFNELLNITWTFSCKDAQVDEEDNMRNRYTFRWTPSEGFTAPTLTQNLIEAECSNASVTSSSGWFRLAFRFGKSAKPTVWICNVTVYGSSTSVSRISSSWIMNTYIALKFSSSVFWDGITPSSVNLSASSMPLNITIASNINVNILIRGDRELTDGDLIPLSNLYVGQTSIPQNNDGIILTTSYQPWKTGLIYSEEQIHHSYWFLTIPETAQIDNYTFTFYIAVIPEDGSIN